MYISKLQNLAWAFFALALTASTIFAQENSKQNTKLPSLNGTCLEQISDLTNVQKAQITEMEQIHQEAIAELRDSRKSTRNTIEKNEIREEMLQVVETHQNSVKNLLSENQQKEYDLLHARGNNSKNRNIENKQGRNGNNGKQNASGRNQGRNGNGMNKNGCNGNNGKGKNGNGKSYSNS